MALRFSTDSKTPSPTEAIDATASGDFVLPDGVSLVGADFVRAGPDLLVETPDGRQIIVRDYFREAAAPDLFDAGGARVDATTVAGLAGPIAPDQVAQAAPGPAAQPIGRVDVATGTVSVLRDGASFELIVGDPVYQGDVIRTGGDGSVGIIFIDETITTLGNASRIVLDELIFDPESEEGSLSMTAVEGLFVVVSGAIAKSAPDAMVIKTPAASIGIRGTLVYLKVTTEGVWMSLGEEAGGYVGQVIVQNDISSVSMDFTGKLVFVPGWVGQAVIRDGGAVFIQSEFDVPRETLEKIFEKLDIETEAGLPDEVPAAALDGLIQATSEPTLVAPTDPEFQAIAQGFNGITFDQNQSIAVDGVVDFSPDSPLDSAIPDTVTPPPADDAPPPQSTVTAADDQVETDQDTAVAGNVIDGDASGLGADSHDDDEPLTVTKVNGVALGGAIVLASGALLTVAADGTFTYDPNGQLDFLGDGESLEETFTYTVSAADGVTDTATVTVTILGVNDAPTAITLDTDVFPENTAGFSANLVVTDVDANDTFTFAIEPGLDADLFQVSANGVLSLAPNVTLDHEDAAFSDTTRQVAVTVTDSGGASLTQVLTIQVGNENEPFSIPGLRDDDGRLIVDVPVQLSPDPADFPASFQVPFVDDDALGDDPGLVPDFVFFGTVRAFTMADDDILEPVDVPDFIQVTFRNDGSFSLIDPDTTLTDQDLSDLEDLVLEIEVRLTDDSGQGLLVDPPSLADGPIDVTLTFTFGQDDDNVLTAFSAFSPDAFGADPADAPLADDDVIEAVPAFGDPDDIVATASISYTDAIDALYNLLANDVAADGGAVTFVGFDAGGLVGELMDDGAGVLSYTLRATDDLASLLSGDGFFRDSFEYTIVDGDGRAATASVEIVIADDAVTLGYQVAQAAPDGAAAGVDAIAA
jgi:VCBS repeat-containing protein